ncbi:hypothetical protein BDQ12DRAFT_671977 [Crucibulum laeve]|uniref:Uncharacterized protein n=1 Tax=Crucibulum laeve TaxID=68775 RepID=A0A5C3LHB1_9AGAR|nr:hypothetical protein BDQ12DRAFT_671977 [Crucibulum laeve]
MSLKISSELVNRIVSGSNHFVEAVNTSINTAKSGYTTSGTIESLTKGYVAANHRSFDRNSRMHYAMAQRSKGCYGYAGRSNGGHLNKQRRVFVTLISIYLQKPYSRLQFAQYNTSLLPRHVPRLKWLVTVSVPVPDRQASKFVSELSEHP